MKLELSSPKVNAKLNLLFSLAVHLQSKNTFSCLSKAKEKRKEPCFSLSHIRTPRLLISDVRVFVVPSIKFHSISPMLKETIISSLEFTAFINPFYTYVCVLPVDKVIL